jgi:bifunctional non-homologous end joining protein LigD
MGLWQYRKKRNFKETPEPRGRAKPSSARWQFVIQKHAASRLHYDFRLELDGTLKSWAVPKGPSLDPSDKRLAVHVEDHPLDYADFEGVIPPKQYGAGTVLLWDRGTWSSIGDPRSGYRRGRLKFRLFGRKLQGAWNLVRMGSCKESGKENWLLIKEDDEEARRGEDGEVTRLTESVASGRSMEQIAAGRHRIWHSNRAEGVSAPALSPKPVGLAKVPQGRKAAMVEWSPPQLATLVAKAPEGNDWVHELKYDGYRILCSIRDGRAKLFTRNGHDWTSKLRRIAQAVEDLPVTQAWLDGELVAVEPDGTISFQVLQNAFDAKSETNLVYYLFDLLYLDGYDVRSVPLIERKRLLASLLESMGPSPLIRYSDHIEGKGEVVFVEACRRGMEGLVSKKAAASYLAGRNRNWVKVKCGRRQEFVIGGFTEPSRSRVAFGALLLGVYNEQGGLQFVGRTGTGFSERSLKQLYRRLTALELTTSPFVNSPTGSESRGVHWVKPELVAEVAFAQWTGEGLLRQASFQGLREDKPAREIVMEQPERKHEQDDRERRAATARRRSWAGIRAARRSKPSSGGRKTGTNPTVVAGVTLSHPDRVLYPEQGLTKIGLAQYYEQVADWILPHLEDRPLTLVRCPEGRAADCFYQKHAKETVSDVIGRVEIQENRKTAVYMTADSLAAVIGLVQMGVLELHTWGATRDLLDRPDRLIIDLDPDPALPWKSVVEAAQLVRSLLNELGLECFLKTTGGKGLHVAMPLQRVHTWDEVKSFSRALAEHLVRLIPDRFVANMSKRKRKGKIYLDFLRNAKVATAIAAYSTRAKPGAPVSVPLTWDELSVDLRSDHFTVANVLDRLKRLRRDPWKDYFTVQQRLTSRMKRMLGMR